MKRAAAFALAWVSPALPFAALAQTQGTAEPRQEAPAPVPEAAGPRTADCTPDDRHGCKPEKRHRLFPIGAEKAAARGYHVPRPWGLGAYMIDNVQDMQSQNLAISLTKGAGDPPADLTNIPFVTTDRMRGHTTNTEFKADLWVLPGLNLFLGLGKVRGDIDIGVAIDLDAFIPPPICRPAAPCGTAHLPFTAKVDNVTTTVGMVAAYGGRGWFVTGALAKTLSVSSKERSDIETVNAGIRGGARFALGRRITLAPYVGLNYFDMDTTVTGIVRSGPVFPDGDAIGLRYQVDLSTQNPWAAIVGANLELGRAWTLQGEYAVGRGSSRAMLGLGLRL